MRLPGGVPERPKGTGCKPVGSAYGGSNPPAPITRQCELARRGSKLADRAVRGWCGRSVGVEINAGQDQRPENRPDQRRDDLPDAVELPSVMMRGRLGAAGHELY